MFILGVTHLRGKAPAVGTPAGGSHWWRTASREGTVNSLTRLLCAGSDGPAGGLGRVAGAEGMWAGH